ncbi:MFS transporter [Xylophilus sp. GOD-11R]|uniref:MFS transporter n=1 Tax=Xylophilus sp. GOD-11R TaxID=3089814 RepID=UPI00298CBE18|nr:MFS transporter [Xylophilus sp. GOD-11R]WPB56504.1 MFS transporter [Xylophilus sp. GOD-11R]
MKTHTLPGTVPITVLDVHDLVYRKVSLRLLPLLFSCYIAAYLDRVNVGFAKLQMQAALQFSDSVYGLGAGVFFIGYFLCEVPSNVLLHRVGARRWIAWIMLVWGVLSMATMFVTSPASFYALRFLLGAAEAGFFPGVILYLTYWFPAARRGRAVAAFLSAIAVAGMLGGPSSGWILQHMGGANGWQAWQWLFLLQASPTIVLALLVWRYLDDRAEQARWLTEDERQLIAADIAHDGRGKAGAGLRAALAAPGVWMLALVYFGLAAGVYGLSFWSPALIGAAGAGQPGTVGLLSAAPWAAGLVAMFAHARRSDRRGELRRHCATAAAVGAAGLIFSVAFHDDLPLALLGLTVATMGVMAALPVFWGLPTAWLGGEAAAAGLALINSVGNLAGFCAPLLLGLLADRSDRLSGANLGVLVLAGALLAGGLLALCTPRLARTR